MTADLCDSLTILKAVLVTGGEGGEGGFVMGLEGGNGLNGLGVVTSVEGITGFVNAARALAEALLVGGGSEEDGGGEGERAAKGAALVDVIQIIQHSMRLLGPNGALHDTAKVRKCLKKSTRYYSIQIQCQFIATDAWCYG